MASNETCLTVSTSNLIDSEGLYFNLYQKPRFKKVLDLAINMPKVYQPPNINLISKDLLDVIYGHKM